MPSSSREEQPSSTCFSGAELTSLQSVSVSLGPNGFGGIQTSPPNIHLVLDSSWGPWWQRYQPISYNLLQIWHQPVSRPKPEHTQKRPRL
ncbi:hypothetical protein AMECASPLE_021800 [Ameca splendens]|uniref:Uncharacterized protein n=1 Tax=Ameca splendens TaxID=208324 RepID=A0ABV0ZZ82_9TELE